MPLNCHECGELLVTMMFFGETEYEGCSVCRAPVLKQKPNMVELTEIYQQWWKSAECAHWPMEDDDG